MIRSQLITCEQNMMREMEKEITLESYVLTISIYIYEYFFLIIVSKVNFIYKAHLTQQS